MLLYAMFIRLMFTGQKLVSDAIDINFTVQLLGESFYPLLASMLLVAGIVVSNGFLHFLAVEYALLIFTLSTIPVFALGGLIYGTAFTFAGVVVIAVNQCGIAFNTKRSM